MREFSKISTEFWTNDLSHELRRLGPVAQMLALYLGTCPHATYTGLYRLPVAYVSADTGLSPEVVRETLDKLVQLDYARYDMRTEVVWVMDSALVQIGESLSSGDKRISAIQREFDAIPPNCSLIEAFYERYGEAYRLRPHRASARQAAKPAPKAPAAPVPAPVAPAPAPVAPAPVAPAPVAPAPVKPATPTVRYCSDALLNAAIIRLLDARDAVAPDTDAGRARIAARITEYADAEGAAAAVTAINEAILGGDLELLTALTPRSYDEYLPDEVDDI